MAINEQIVLEVKDRIAPTIVHNIRDIGRVAKATQNDVDNLQRAIRSMNSGGGGGRAGGATGAAATARREADATIREARRAASEKERLERWRQQLQNRHYQESERQARAAEARAAAADQRALQRKIRLHQQTLRLGAGRAGGGGGGMPTGAGAADGGGGLMNAIGGAAMRNPYTAAAAAMVAGATVVGKYADSYNVLRNRVQTATGSLETTGPVIDRIREIANKTAAPLNDTGEAFVRFNRALGQMGKSQEEALQFTETLQTMLFRYGKTGSEAASATLQLTQAMGKGKLDGDEFKSVMENLPELGNELAKSLGVTKAELRDMAPEGKITGDVIFKAMIQAQEGLSKLPVPLDTADASLTRLSNNATQFFGEMALGQAVIGAFTGTVNALAKALEKVDSIDNIEERVKALAAQNEIDAKNVSTPGNDRAQRDIDMQKKIAANEKARADILEEEGQQIERNLELQKMTAEQRFIESGLDKLREKADKKHLTFAESELDESREQLRQTYLLQQTEKAGKKGPNRAEEIAKINLQLDNQISRSRLLEADREKQARFDQIQESLSSKKISLLDVEAEALKKKIAQSHEALIVQGKLDQLYNEAIGPVKEYEAAFAAADQLFLDSVISEEQYIRATNKAGIALQQATDLSYDFNIEMQQQTDLLQFNSREREIEAQVLDRVNTLVAEGVDRREIETDALRKQYIEQRALNEARQAEDTILDNVIGKQRKSRQTIQAMREVRSKLPEEIAKENPTQSKEWAAQEAKGRMAQETSAMMGEHGSGTGEWWQAALQSERDYYQQIDDMRKANLISEQTAETAKLRMRIETNSKITSMATGFFSEWEGLQRSNISEMAAIGKAAAISNATIAAYEGANKAYASLAGLGPVGPALGAAAAAGAIATGMVNVAAIASQPTGFAAGGYTGDMSPSQVAGVVHGKEYVFDAQSTSRIGRENLDAMRSGAAPAAATGAAGGAAQLNLTLIMVSDKEEANSVAAQQKGDAMVIGAIGRNPKQVRRMIGK